jgi:hypothetical protein
MIACLCLYAACMLAYVLPLACIRVDAYGCVVLLELLVGGLVLLGCLLLSACCSTRLAALCGCRLCLTRAAVVLCY